MKLRVLGCFGGDLKGRLPAFLVNDQVLLDAGTVGIALDWKAQQKIRSVLITHHHIDHLVGLPFFLDAAYSETGNQVRLYALPKVLKFIREHLLNDVIWPDFTQLPTPGKSSLKIEEIELFKEYPLVDNLYFMPIPTCHIGPSAGFIIREENSAMVYSGDTGVCPEFWKAIRQWDSDHPQCNIKTILIECSFPDRMKDFAHRTGHLAPRLLVEDIRRSGFNPPELLIFHMKPQHIDEIKSDIESISDYRVKLVSPDQVFTV